jgi:hypothetical protein
MVPLGGYAASLGLAFYVLIAKLDILHLLFFHSGLQNFAYNCQHGTFKEIL